ncbi:MAG: hypothetical protein WB818_18260, partial [Desulfobacterales bacterium]
MFSFFTSSSNRGIGRFEAITFAWEAIIHRKSGRLNTLPENFPVGVLEFGAFPENKHRAGGADVGIEVVAHGFTNGRPGGGPNMRRINIFQQAGILDNFENAVIDTGKKQPSTA